ncbi:Vesicle-associated protein 4-2 [Linum perenne]
MRPPGGILAPGESLIATVFKFVEPPENNEKQVLDVKSRVKFKIVSLKVKGEMEYVPELFDEQKEQVAVEQILRVVFLDPETQTPALQKLKRQLAEAEAELENRKKPPEEPSPRTAAAADLQYLNVHHLISLQKERRERYLAQQQVELGPV